MKIYILSFILMLISNFNVSAFEFKENYNLQLAYEQATAKNKKLLLYFHQDNCIFCDKIESEFFADEEINTFIQQHFDVLKINIYGTKKIIDFDGKHYTEKNFRQQYTDITPAIVLTHPKNKMQDVIYGYTSSWQVFPTIEQWSKKGNE